MSWGLIPIATSHGFNKTVIGNERLCVNQLIVDEFVDIISDIIMNGEMDRLSFEMYERVQNFYTENKVFYNLKQKYNDLFDSYQNKET